MCTDPALPGPLFGTRIEGSVPHQAVVNTSYAMSAAMLASVADIARYGKMRLEHSRSGEEEKEAIRAEVQMELEGQAESE